MTESEVREAVEYYKLHELSGILDALVSLAEAWLGRKDLRKVVGEAVGEASMCWSETPSGVFESTRALGIVNKILDACRLASVVSEEKIEKILEEHITHILHYHDKEGGRTSKAEIIFKQRFGEVSHAIAEYVNGEGR